MVGRFIEVVDDTAGPTGGAYICTWLGRAGYDSWVESVDDVDDFIVQASLVVEWFEAPPADSLDGRPRHA